MSDQGTHLIKRTIYTMTEEFELHHQKNTPYHPQEKRTVESFNKILENALTKICNVKETTGTSKYQKYYGNIGLHAKI
jgi:hypothetical protein